MAACLWLAVGASGLLVQPEPHWGSVAPRYSSYYCDGSLKRTVPRRLGKGLHGEVLLGESSQNSGEQVAIKVGFRRGDIEREASVLSAMAGVAGFPKVLLNEPPNEQSKGGVLVMELLGPSLDELCMPQRARTLDSRQNPRLADPRQGLPLTCLSLTLDRPEDRAVHVPLGPDGDARRPRRAQPAAQAAT